MKSLVFLISSMFLTSLVSMEDSTCLGSSKGEKLSYYRQKNPSGILRTPAVVNALAIAEFEKKLIVVAGLNDSRVALYDLSTKEKLGIFDEHNQRVRTVDAVMHDNKLFVTSGANDRRVCIRKLLWNNAKNLFSAQLAKEYEETEHQDTVTAVTHADRGELKNIISASLDGTIRIWDLEGNLLATSGKNEALEKDRAPRPPLYSLIAMQEDKKFKIVTGGIDNITVWDDTCHKITEFDLRKLPVPVGIITSLICSPVAPQDAIVAGSSHKRLLKLNLKTRAHGLSTSETSVESLGGLTTPEGHWMLVGDLYEGCIRKLDGDIVAKLGNRDASFKAILGIQNGGNIQIITAQLKNICIWNVLKRLKK